MNPPLVSATLTITRAEVEALENMLECARERPLNEFAIKTVSELLDKARLTIDLAEEFGQRRGGEEW